MDDISKKREALISVYPRSPRWRKRVTEMSEPQVIAIYLRYKEQNKL